MKKVKDTSDLEKLREKIIKSKSSIKTLITICSGTGCHVYGSENVVKKFKDEIKKKNLTKKIAFKSTGCHGLCEKGPIVVIHPQEIFYQKVKIEDVSKIIQGVLENEIIDELLYLDEKTGKKIIKEKDIPFLQKTKTTCFW